MPVAHFCSNCGEFSQQDGVWTHAVECPNCGHVERQNPHAPDISVRASTRQGYQSAPEAHGVVAVEADTEG